MGEKEATKGVRRASQGPGEESAVHQHSTALHIAYRYGSAAAVEVTTSPRLQAAALSANAHPPPQSTLAAAAPSPHLIQSGQVLLKQGLGLALELLFRELGAVTRGGRGGGRGPET